MASESLPLSEIWSPSFCLAPWLSATVSIVNGSTASCDLVQPHPIDVTQLQLNPTALHNTDQKKALRKKMLNAEQPVECQICWSCEKKHPQKLSPRHIQNQKYDLSLYESLANSTGQENINLRQLKIQFAPNPTNLQSATHSMLRKAFWRWWPELCTTLSELHIKDSLSSRDLWTLLDEFGDQGGSPKSLDLIIEDHFQYAEDLIERFIEKTYYTQNLTVIARLESVGQSPSSPMNLPQWLNAVQKILIYAKAKHIRIELTQQTHADLFQSKFWPLVAQLKDQFAEQYFSLKVTSE